MSTLLISLLFLKVLLVWSVLHLLVVVCRYPVASQVLIFVSSGSFILGSHDKDDGPQLYMVDPSGISYVSYPLTNKSCQDGSRLDRLLTVRASNNARYIEWA